jgi:hypothetical protein
MTVGTVFAKGYTNRDPFHTLICNLRNWLNRLREESERGGAKRRR